MTAAERASLETLAASFSAWQATETAWQQADSVWKADVSNRLRQVETFMERTQAVKEADQLRASASFASRSSSWQRVGITGAIFFGLSGLLIGLLERLHVI